MRKNLCNITTFILFYKISVSKSYSAVCNYYVTDVPSIDIPSSKEDKSLRRKWLMDLCSKYIDKFVVNTHEVTVLVEQTRELHKASQQPFKCREPYCQQTYVYHSGRVK